MQTALKASYRRCEEVAHSRARNFYYAFKVLPEAKRQAICSMYAFMRCCDDLADSDEVKGDKRLLLEKWRSVLDDALHGDYSASPILPAFHDSVRAFGIPSSYFHELIDGAEMDLSTNRYETFDELYSYCYRVASVVGLVCIHIFGFQSDEAKEHAEHCGIAFQLTNILRDIKEDSEHNRIYLPQEDLSRFGYSEDDLMNGVVNDRFRDMMRFEVGRAQDFYDKAKPLIHLIDLSSRGGLAAMMGIYHALLDRIVDNRYDVFNNRIKLTTAEKLNIAARSMLWTNPGGREHKSAEIHAR